MVMSKFEQQSIEQKERRYVPVFDTSEKIALIKERAEGLIENILKEKPDVLFFMDRSARPLAYILRKAWDESKYGKLPKIKFVNIGREKGSVLGFSGMLPSRYDDDKKRLKTQAEWEKDVAAYWGKLDSDDYVEKVRKDIYKSLKKTISADGRVRRGKFMLIDDDIVSGYSMDLARKFFNRHFRFADVVSDSFFKKADREVFHAPEGVGPWNGIYLPWHYDKSYTLMGDDEEPRSVVARPERDKSKRATGIALRKEIDAIFERK